jgi:hypothetical protein
LKSYGKFLENSPNITSDLVVEQEDLKRKESDIAAKREICVNASKVKKIIK